MAPSSQSNAASNAEPSISAIFQGLRGAQLYSSNTPPSEKDTTPSDHDPARSDKDKREHELDQELRRLWEGSYYPPEFAPIFDSKRGLPAKNLLYEMRGLTRAWHQLHRPLAQLWEENGLLRIESRKTSNSRLTAAAAKNVRTQVEKMVASLLATTLRTSTAQVTEPASPTSTTQQATSPEPTSMSADPQSNTHEEARAGNEETPAPFADGVGSSEGMVNSNGQDLLSSPNLPAAAANTRHGSRLDTTRTLRNPPILTRSSSKHTTLTSRAPSAAPSTPRDTPVAQFQPVVTPELFRCPTDRRKKPSSATLSWPYSALGGESNRADTTFSDSGFEGDLSSDSRRPSSATQSTITVFTKKIPSANASTSLGGVKSGQFTIEQKGLQACNKNSMLKPWERLLEGLWLQSNDIEACLSSDTLPPGWFRFDAGFPNLETTRDRLMDLRRVQNDNIVHIIFVLHLQQNHWAVGHWDREACVFTLYDPMRCPIHFQQVHEFMSEWLTGSELGTQVIQIVEGNCPQQEDGTNCAMYCITFARALLKDEPIPFFVDADGLRKEYGAKLRARESDLASSNTATALSSPASSSRPTLFGKGRSRQRGSDGIAESPLQRQFFSTPKRPLDTSSELEIPAPSPLKRPRSKQSSSEIFNVRNLEDTVDKYSQAILEKRKRMEKLEQEKQKLKREQEELDRKNREIEREKGELVMEIGHHERQIEKNEKAIAALSEL